MTLSRTLGIMTAALLSSGCDNIASSMRAMADAISSAGKEVSDVGVISELGWLSKTLRDSAKGTPQERANARAAATRLFGITDDELNRSGDLSLAVTVEFSGYDLQAEMPLQFSMRFTGSPKEAAMAKLFLDGNGWNPIDLTTAPMFKLNSDGMNALIERRLLSLPIACTRTRVIGTAVTVGCSVGNLPVGTVASGPIAAPSAAATEVAQREALVGNLRTFARTLAVTPETTGMPTSEGSLSRYQMNWGYGETNLLPFAVVFMPVAQVMNYPGLKVKAWLHLTTDTTRIVGGLRRPIVATDFVERCKNAVPKNPTPAVDSRTLAGPLCWYAFDLLGDGVRENITTVRKEIENVDKQQERTKKTGA